MNKFLRIISTLVVGVGLLLLFAYLNIQNSRDTAKLLSQPSYYTLKNYWYLFAAGCGCVAFSILSCFFAWNRKMDEKVEILPNAVAAEKTELLGWLSGSSLDTAGKVREQEKTVLQAKYGDAAVRKSGSETETWKSQEKTAADSDNTVITGAGTVFDSTKREPAAQTVTVLDDDASITELADSDTAVLSEGTEKAWDDEKTVVEKG